MKHLKYISIIALVFLIASCSNSEGSDMVPNNPPQGDYFYESASAYYLGNGTLEKEAQSLGSMTVNQNGSSMNIYITPSLGYAYSITATNLQNHGDTTTFRISMQQIYIQGETFNLDGTNSIPVANLGNYDGYYTNDNIVFAFRSTNILNYDWVHTTTEATKRN